MNSRSSPPHFNHRCRWSPYSASAAFTGRCRRRAFRTFRWSSAIVRSSRLVCSDTTLRAAVSFMPVLSWRSCTCNPRSELWYAVRRSSARCRGSPASPNALSNVSQRRSREKPIQTVNSSSTTQAGSLTCGGVAPSFVATGLVPSASHSQPCASALPIQNIASRAWTARFPGRGGQPFSSRCFTIALMLFGASDGRYSSAIFSGGRTPSAVTPSLTNPLI